MGSERGGCPTRPAAPGDATPSTVSSTDGGNPLCKSNDEVGGEEDGKPGLGLSITVHDVVACTTGSDGDCIVPATVCSVCESLSFSSLSPEVMSSALLLLTAKAACISYSVRFITCTVASSWCRRSCRGLT